jgi:hypothetical protein
VTFTQDNVTFTHEKVNITQEIKTDFYWTGFNIYYTCLILIL